MRGGRFGLIAICLVGGALLPAAAGAATFTNPEALKTTPNSSDAYALLPYPSQIFVQGQQGTVTKATITLSRIAHERMDQLSALLVAPGGQYARFMSRVCGSQNTSTNPLTFTFDDSAGSSLSETGPCTSGTYKSSDHTFPSSTFDFPYPAPPRPYPATLAAVTGAQPNGPWKLFVNDGTLGEAGGIEGGWSLELPTTGAPPTPKKKCKKRHKRSASSAKKRCKKKKR